MESSPSSAASRFDCRGGMKTSQVPAAQSGHPLTQSTLSTECDSLGAADRAFERCCPGSDAIGAGDVAGEGELVTEFPAAATRPSTAHIADSRSAVGSLGPSTGQRFGHWCRHSVLSADAVRFRLLHASIKRPEHSRDRCAGLRAAILADAINPDFKVEACNMLSESLTELPLRPEPSADLCYRPPTRVRGCLSGLGLRYEYAEP